MLSQQRTMALLAGISLVAMALIAGLGYGYAFQSFYVANDAASTLKNLQASPLLVRSFIFSFLVILVLDVVIAFALYKFFARINEAQALLSAWLRVAYAPILGVALASVVGALQVIRTTNPGSTTAASNMVMAHLNTFLDVWSLGLIVFGVHLLVLGWQMFVSRIVPRVLGVLMVFAAVCYVFTNSANVLLPNYAAYRASVDAVLSLPMALGELAFAVWLVAKGGKTQS